MYYPAACPSPPGILMLGSDREHLIDPWPEGWKYSGGVVREAPEERDGLLVFGTARDQLARYLAGEKPMPSELPLCPIGGEFRQRVWRLLCQIPHGETTTYGALARALAVRIGRPSMSSQVVGGAVGHNPISVIIPCHRAVGSGGSLIGYVGGIAAKLRSLEYEGAELSRLSVPKRGTTLWAMAARLSRQTRTVLNRLFRLLDWEDCRDVEGQGPG